MSIRSRSSPISCIGKREVSISNGSQTYTMSGLEFFRLGLGAEIRLATLFSLTPLFSISGGSFNDTEGNVNFVSARRTAPTGCRARRITNGQVLDTARAYVVLSLGVGLHFDIFGK